MGNPAIRAKLMDLYSRVPSMQCKPGCYDCCNLIQWLPEEWERVADKREPTSDHCPYASREGCAIHEQRAFVCRIYGTVDDPRLRCPHGCKPDRYLTAQEGTALLKEYGALF